MRQREITWAERNRVVAWDGSLKDAFEAAVAVVVVAAAAAAVLVAVAGVEWYSELSDAKLLPGHGDESGADDDGDVDDDACHGGT